VTTAPSELESPEVDEAIELSPPWVTIVWNDPVNLMDYVTFVFQTYFGYSKAKAEKLMMQVHQQPRGDGTRCRSHALLRPVGHL
jgi:ATP-dependent Clp protease adaptor protein ClpS